MCIFATLKPFQPLNLHMAYTAGDAQLMSTFFVDREFSYALPCSVERPHPPRSLAAIHRNYPHDLQQSTFLRKPLYLITLLQN